VFRYGLPVLLVAVSVLALTGLGLGAHMSRLEQFAWPAMTLLIGLSLAAIQRAGCRRRRVLSIDELVELRRRQGRVS